MPKPSEKKFQHLIGKKVSVKVKLQSNREMNVSGIFKGERHVYGRIEVGLKVDGMKDLQWFNSSKIVTI